ncbi:hypothetical protein CDAR_452911 [Caerostris darwini]|uniref:Uncharacterized protein n=1 Tax=Caerostris darwini TaxID=1538125 RepID=A0AAV4RJV2_9ARAC|nr:hypothetical protein CDAR_452911 [Caerostris darwini]
MFLISTDGIWRSFKRKVGGCFQNFFLLLCITEASASATVAFPLLCSSGTTLRKLMGFSAARSRPFFRLQTEEEDTKSFKPQLYVAIIVFSFGLALPERPPKKKERKKRRKERIVEELVKKLDKN